MKSLLRYPDDGPAHARAGKGVQIVDIGEPTADALQMLEEHATRYRATLVRRMDPTVYVLVRGA